MKLWQLKDLYPKFIQYDPSTQKTLLLQELKNKAGVYCWYNTSRDLFYIGSSDNLRQRMYCYLSLAFLTSRKDSSIIHRALLKYGFSSFVLLILETLEPGKKEQLVELEQRAIDLCKPSYNILTTAGSSLGFKHALESLAKMSGVKKGELNPMFGKEKSPEFIAMQCGENKRGKNNPSYGKPSLPHFSKYIQPKPVYVYDSVSKELLMSFPEGIVVATKALKIGYHPLKRCCISEPKEVFTPRKGPLQNRTLIFSHTPLS